MRLLYDGNRKLRIIKESKRVIPKGFTEVEYLESTGTQYIDTGYNPGENASKFTFDIEISCIANSSGHGAIGSRSIDTGRNWVITNISNAGTNYQQFGYGSNYTNITSESSGKLLRCRTYITGTNYIMEVSIDGQSYTSSMALETFTNTANIYLCAINNKGSVFSNFPFFGKIYYAKMYQDGTLVRDFIPCIDPQGIACLYDKVGNKAYYNQGTGSFTVGRKIIPVEYLQSTGTQHIDTGYLPTIKTRWEYDFQYLELGTFCANGSLANSPSVQRIVIGVEANKKANMSFGGDNITNVDIDTNRHLFIIDCENMFWSIDNNTGTYTTTVEDIGTNSIYFFARNRNNAAQYRCTGRLYASKIYDNSVLARDFIPCKDENDVGFMFDKVSHRVYLNAGTGDFVVGNEVKDKIRLLADPIPNIYKRVNYIASTGTQYILTDFTPTVNTDFEVELSSTKTNSNNWVMGCATWVGVHYKQSGDDKVGVTNNSNAASQQYIAYTPNNSKITLKLSGNTVYANEVSLGTITRYAASQNLALFGYQTNETTTQLQFTGSIYKCIIWENGIPVRDFYPALRKSDNKLGMYDRITKQFYVNAAQSGNDFNYG